MKYIKHFENSLEYEKMIKNSIDWKLTNYLIYKLTKYEDNGFKTAINIYVKFGNLTYELYSIKNNISSEITAKSLDMDIPMISIFKNNIEEILRSDKIYSIFIYKDYETIEDEEQGISPKIDNKINMFKNIYEEIKSKFNFIKIHKDIRLIIKPN